MDSSQNRGSYGFPKTARLTRSAEFEKIKKNGQSYQGKFMVLSVLQTSELGTRVGLITSRRIGNAVKRNKTRRQLRELVRHLLPRMKPGLWLVLIARKNAVSAEFKTIEREWLSLAVRASILID